ncbi:MAG: sialidase family protein [Capsulimonadales bacterium]|nr:sialidase family protein [Capsulimonadales bacterium]
MPVLARHFILDRPPFVECHAVTVAETRRGPLAAFFAGPYERHPEVGIRTALFDGERWLASYEVANGLQPDGERFPTWNPVLFPLPDGELLLFYKVGPSPETWWGMLLRSTDDGRTWSEPERLPDGILGPIKNKPILLADGTLLCPSSKEEPDGYHICFERSPDGGRTWESTGPLHPTGHPNVIQPTVFTLNDGSLLSFGRTHHEGFTAETRSVDGGRTWSPVVLNSLPNPNSGLDGVTLRDGRHLLVYNHGVIPPGGWTQRSPLNVTLSEDGTNWSAALILESEEGEFSYPAVIQMRDGSVLIAYTWNRRNLVSVVLDPDQLVPVPIRDGVWPDGVPRVVTGAA